MRGPSLVDLDSRFVGPVFREADALVVVPKSDGTTVFRTQFEGVPDASHLVRLRVTGSSVLSVDLVTEGRVRIHELTRLEPGIGGQRAVLHPTTMPPRTELRLGLRSPWEVRISALTVRELSPAHRWLPRLVRALTPLLAAALAYRHRRWLRGLHTVPEPPKRDRVVLALALFLVCFFVFYDAPVAQLFDGRYLSVVTDSLLSFGTVRMPVGFLDVDPADTYQLVRRGDAIVHYFSDAPAVLNTPFSWAAGLAGLRPIDDSGVYSADAEEAILRLSSAVVAAGLCVLLYGIARRWHAPGPSLALATMFAFGTQIFSTISRPYWSHAWASLLLAGALYLLVAPWARDRPGAYVAIASLLSWAFFCRPSLSLSVVAVTALVAVGRRSRLPFLLVPGLLWLALFVLYSLRTFGEILPGYTLGAHLNAGRLGGEILAASYHRAVLGTLFSPGRGLFVFVPLYALVLWWVARHWRRLPDRPLAIAALAVIGAHWQLISAFRNWWGGASYGPRLFSDVVVWFFVLAALGLEAANRALESRQAAARLPRTVGILTVIALSLLINARGAYSLATKTWGQAPAPSRPSHRHLWIQSKVWDWRDPQFLAGWTRRPHTQPAPTISAPPIEPAVADPTAGGARKLRLEILSPESVELTWRDRSDHETSFVIHARAGGRGRFRRVAAVPRNVTRAVVTGLTPGATYKFRVRAMVRNRGLRASNTLTVTMPELPPT